jgi:hypothetical protein
MRLASAVGRYVRHENRLVATANLLALSIASNQPFYPAMVYLALGKPLAVSFWTFLSTPFFLAVPAVARRSAMLGRALLVATGIGNTLLCLLLYGEASGVGLFLLPCVTIAALSFSPDERPAQWALVALGVVSFIGTHGHVPRVTASVPADAYEALWTLHAYSVALLTGLVGLVFSRSDGGSLASSKGA